MADELGLIPDLGGISLAEVGLALKPHLLAPMSVGKLRFAAQRPRAGVSPFRSRFAPQRLKIALVGGRKGRAQLGQAEGAKASLDEYTQEADLEAGHSWSPEL